MDMTKISSNTKTVQLPDALRVIQIPVYDDFVPVPINDDITPSSYPTFKIKEIELKWNGKDIFHAYDEKTDTYYFSLFK